MKLSVIVACYNAEDTIEETLASLRDQEWSSQWNVIIADNGSTDNTVQVVEQCKKKPKDLVIVDASARKGPAYARNFGVSCSFADAFIFCDADDVVAPGWLEGLGKALLKYDVVVSRFKSFSTNHVLGIKEFEDGVQSKEIQKLWFSPYCLHASSCGLGVKREVHEKVNGFDEMIPALEDTDYCIRIQRSGFDLHFVPEAVVYYRLRSDFKALLKQRRLWRFCCMMLYKKYRLSSPTISEQVRMWRAFFFSIFTLMVRLFTIANRQKRVVFVRKLGNLLGQIQGIIKCRVPPV